MNEFKASKARKYRPDIQERVKSCLDEALQKHSKVFFMRLDVRFPEGFVHDGTNTQVSKLMHRVTKHFKGIDCGYVWAREQETSENPHYHVAMLLNGSRLDNGWKVKDVAAHKWADVLKQSCDGCVQLCETGDDTGIKIVRATRQSEGEKRRLEDRCREEARSSALEWGNYLAKTKGKEKVPAGVRKWGSSRF